MNKQQETWRHRLPFYYGWIVVAVAGWSTFFTGPGQTYSYSIFIDSFIRDFGWSRTLVSSMYSAATLVSGLLMSVMGALVDRWGSRLMCVAAGLLLGAACLWSSFIVSPLMLLIGFFLGRFSGQGTLGLSSTTLAPRWFVRRRALAIMLVGIGQTASSMLFPILNNRLVSSFGWRGAFRALAGGVWILYVPVALLLIVSKPEKIGMSPDGDRPAPASGGGQRSEISLTRGEALRTPAFWLVCYCFFQFALVQTGIGLHFLSIFAERGYDAAFAARVMSIRPGVGLGATVLMGLFMDRIRRPQIVLAFLLATQCISYFLLIRLSGDALPYIYAVISGTAGATIIYTIGVLRPFLFGREHIGAVAGIMSVITLIGSALGPLPYGAAFDFFGGYREILMISATLPAAAAVAALMIRRPARSKLRGASAP